MPSDQLRSHLVLMSQALNQVVQLISKEKITVSVVSYSHYVNCVVMSLLSYLVAVQYELFSIVL